MKVTFFLPSARTRLLTISSSSPPPPCVYCFFSRSLSPSLSVVLPVIMHLTGALQACCLGDWSKGADERASSASCPPPTLTPPAPPLHLFVPPPFLCGSAGSLPSVSSRICLPFVISHSGGKCCIRHKLAMGRFLLRAPTTRSQ